MISIHRLNALPDGWNDAYVNAALAGALLAQKDYALWGVGACAEDGYALVHTPPEMPAELLTLWVPEACRGQGHAKALLRYVLGTLSQPLLLEVRASNMAARGLYAGLGGEQIHVRPGYYAATAEAPAEDALVLRLQPR